MPDRGRQALWTVLGVSAGVAAGVWVWTRVRQPETPFGAERRERPAGLAQEVARSLRSHPDLARRPIDVDTVADGVIELSGRVRTRSEAERAVAAAQGQGGVYTVVNRLVIEDEEAHREETRRRRENGAPELNTRGHSGMGVGMEARRQSPDTDPDRPSDKQKILDRELDVGNVEDTPEGGPGPVSGSEAVESTDFKPGDERAIREAGLDADKEATSAPKESVEEEPEETGTEESGEEAERT